MSTSALPSPPPASAERARSPEQTLRKLFLMLFLRGRTARGLKKKTAPTSIVGKLWITLGFYALFGLFALLFRRQPIFALSVYLHAMTFMFLGMFVASSAGEILFNKEEADILLHRPVSPRALLWAKVRVLVEVSLWLAGAFNLVSLYVGMTSPGGGWLFPIAHALSTIMEAMFCTGCVVVAYQLCLRWFGRERLEGLMTTAQVLVSIAVVLSGQILPRVMFRADKLLTVRETSWWIAFLPPAWFAGFDDALAGTSAMGSWLLAALGIVVTFIILWAAFGKLAHDYETGLQLLGEATTRRKYRGERRRWIDRLVDIPPLSWWLRNPVERASFLLTAAYLVRDRDVKLRIYPGIAPMMAMPLIVVFGGFGGGRAGGMGSGFGTAFAASYLGIIPLLALTLLQYSQQWQASDIFRVAPMIGPAPLCHGARRAVLCLLIVPVLIAYGLILWLPHRNLSALLMLLPGIIALPIYALVPALGGGSVPLSLPTEGAKSTGRGITMMVAMFSSFAISGLAILFRYLGCFWWFILFETLLASGVYAVMRRSMSKEVWSSLD